MLTTEEIIKIAKLNGIAVRKTIVAKRAYQQPINSSMKNIDYDNSDVNKCIKAEDKNMITTVKFAKTNPKAKIPTKRNEDAGFDIYACFDENIISIEPNQTKLIPTGIATACDKNYYIQVHERGSTGSLGFKVSAGVIDSGYRGEIFIALTNCNKKTIIVCKDCDKVLEDEKNIYYPYSKAIAQLIVHPIPFIEAEEYTYEELKHISSERGDGCIGSTGR